MKGWRDMDNGNVELYYAMVNVLDWYGKKNIDDWGVSMTIQRILEDIESLSEDNTPQAVGDANDCGECRMWTDVMKGFRELWKNGERE